MTTGQALMMPLSYQTLRRRTKFLTKLRAVCFVLYAALMIFDPFLGLFDGGKPSLLIPDDDVILPGTPRDSVWRAVTDALWTYRMTFCSNN
jgi:hypothetical protein